MQGKPALRETPALPGYGAGSDKTSERRGGSPAWAIPAGHGAGQQTTTTPAQSRSAVRPMYAHLPGLTDHQDRASGPLTTTATSCAVPETGEVAADRCRHRRTGAARRAAIRAAVRWCGSSPPTGTRTTSGPWRTSSPRPVRSRPRTRQDADCPAGARLAERLHDGDEVAVGAARLQVIHLAGHTPGGAALLYDAGGELADSPAPVHRRLPVPGRPGRTPQNDPERFTQLMDDLETKVFGPLPDSTWIYPGPRRATPRLGAERPHVWGVARPRLVAGIRTAGRLARRVRPSAILFSTSLFEPAGVSPAGPPSSARRFASGQ